MNHSTPNVPTLHLLGIDGGGTKTEALIADLDGALLGRGIGGPSNYHKTGIETALRAIEEALTQAYAEAGIQPRNAEVAAIVLGMAGVDRPEDTEHFHAWLERNHAGVPALVINDAELVLPAGTPEGWGVGVICGTGATIVGRNRAGESARADGWGYLLGDAGSGFWIGVAALRNIMRAEDGRGGKTSLTAKVLDFWKIANPGDIMERVYLMETGPDQIAALAALVTEAADEGDAVAIEILRAAGAEIAHSIDAVVTRLGLAAPVPIGLAGGVIVNSRTMQEATRNAARGRGLELAPVTIVDKPALGAIRMAQMLLAPTKA